MTLGQRIRAVRKRRGLSLRFVARRAGVDRAHLSNIERGKCSGIAGPGMLIVAAIAEVLDVSLDKIVPPMHGGCLGKFEVQRRVK